MDMLLELLGANIELVITFFCSAIIILLGMLAKKTGTKLDDQVVEFLKENEEAIKIKAMELAKAKIEEAIAKKKKDK